MAELPQGTLTFLLTDLEGSTRTWEATPELMRAAMARHDAIVYGAVERNTGAMVESGREGDSVLAVFVRAREAAACALEIQRAFRAAEWPGGLSMRVRIALHTGEVELRGGHYFGSPLNRCARVLALCHAGQTLVTRATMELLAQDAPPDVELTDLGLHRLKDLRRSEHVFQLTDVTRTERFPPLQARRDYRTNLTAALTSFVGRHREIDELRGLLQGTRLLTLTGAGGVGKTRLAKELALEVAADMPGGAWLVDLAPVSDPALVPRTVASVLDVEEQRGRALIETLLERCGERAMLLLLDNCEHLLQACAELATAMLTACPKLRILATSREALDIDGEVTWRVPSLEPSEALRLFHDRARSRSPRADETQDDGDLIELICQRLDGIPLAIELAAARSAIMTSAEMLKRLDAGLAVIGGGRRTAPQRQRTLEAAIGWSYDLLTDAERMLLRRLSMFAGPFSIDAAEAVCESEELPGRHIVEHLGQLAAKSLVQPTGDRYRLLETIRAYARARLGEAGEAERCAAAHAAYYLGVVRSRRPGALAEWLDAVEADHDDVRAALRWCLDRDLEIGSAMAAGLYEFWLLRGFAVEARGFLEELIARLTDGAPGSRALIDAGAFAYTAGDPEAGAALIRRGLAGARAIGDDELIARGLVFEGGVAIARADLDTADAALAESIALARRSGNGPQQAETLHHLGVLAIERGDMDTARTRLSESLALRRQLGIGDQAGTTLTLLGTAAILASDLPAARTAIVDALGIALALRDRRAAWALDALACLTALEGEAERALRLAGAAEAMFEASGQRPPPAWRRITAPVLERARASLGSEAAEAAWASGRALAFEPALRYALEGEPATASAVPPR